MNIILDAWDIVYLIMWTIGLGIGLVEKNKTVTYKILVPVFGAISLYILYMGGMFS